MTTKSLTPNPCTYTISLIHLQFIPIIYNHIQRYTIIYNNNSESNASTNTSTNR